MAVVLFAIGAPSADPGQAEIEPIYTLPFHDTYEMTCGWHCYYHPDYGWHVGSDYKIGDSAAGEFVAAAAAGTAKPCDFDINAGNYIVIDHGNGHRTRSLHLNTPPLPEDGEQLTRGQIIGYEGSTGYTDPPGFNHLHFETRHEASTFTCGKDGTPYSQEAQATWPWTEPYPGPQSYACDAPAAPYPDGSLFSEEHSAGIYVIYGQARFAIPDPQTLIDLGLAGEPVICVPDGFMGSVSATPEDGTMLQQLGSATQYIVNCSAKFGIPDPATVTLMVTNGYGNSYPNLVPAGALGFLTSVPYEGCHFGEHESAAQWVTCQDQKWLIPGTQAVTYLGLSGATQRTMWPGALDTFFTTFQNLNDPICSESEVEGDGFSDLAETFMGTDPLDNCGEHTTSAPIYSQSFPADTYSTSPSTDKVTIQDLTSFTVPDRRLSTSPGDPDYHARWDVLPGPGTFSDWINIQDLTIIITVAPDMFGGSRAFGYSTPCIP